MDRLEDSVVLGWTIDLQSVRPLYIFNRSLSFDVAGTLSFVGSVSLKTDRISRTYGNGAADIRLIIILKPTKRAYFNVI